MTLEDRFVGCLLGAALGDSQGACHEGGLIERAVWRVLVAASGESMRWTDDTQMTLILAESLAQDGRVMADRLARRWAAAARWSRGYGPGALRVLKRIAAGEDWRAANRSVFSDGSSGNGGAMRAAPVGLFYHRTPRALDAAAALSARITHAHPLGMEGAVTAAQAAAAALDDRVEPKDLPARLADRSRVGEYGTRLRKAAELLERPVNAVRVRAELGCSVRALESVATAVYSFCRFHDDFTEMMEFIIELGGDVDTIGAMAGALFGARSGTAALPGEPLAMLEAKERIEAAGRALYRRFEAEQARPA